MNTTDELVNEANIYADKHGFRIPYDGSNDFYDELDVKCSKEGFIAGANSKYVEKQKILFTLEVIDKIRIDLLQQLERID